MLFKRVKVVMLPTNEKANIKLGKNKLLVCNTLGYDAHFTNQHLYIVSNETKKDGDWVLPNDLNNPFNRKPYKFSSISAPLPYWCNPDSCKKIISTTDILFTPTKDMINPYLPQPSDSFIKYFIVEYNKGNIITDVMVEYEEAEEYDKVYGHENKFPRLLINSDNTINIKLIKDSWNREEVIELMAKAFYTDCRVWKNKYQDWEEVDFDEWMEKNFINL